MAPTEIDLVLRSIEVLRDEMRLAIKELRDDAKGSDASLRTEVTSELADHERRLRFIEDRAARDEAVDGFKDTMRKRVAEDRKWRVGQLVALSGIGLTSLLTLLRLLGLL